MSIFCVFKTKTPRKEGGQHKSPSSASLMVGGGGLDGGAGRIKTLVSSVNVKLFSYNVFATT